MKSLHTLAYSLRPDAAHAENFRRMPVAARKIAAQQHGSHNQRERCGRLILLVRA
jgi:hypothetical protein